MAKKVISPIWSEDGKTLTNALVNDKLKTYNVVENWYDGTPMDETKVDDDLVYISYEGKFLRENFVKEVDTFLEKDTIEEFRQLSTKELLLLKMKVYKGVKLNGYYTEGDTPTPIEYYISNTSNVDNSFDIIKIGSVKFQTYFKDNIIHASYAGVLADGVTNNNIPFSRVIDYINTYKNGVLYTPAGKILLSRDSENTLFFIKNVKNFVIHAEQTTFCVNDLDDFINVNLSYTNVSGVHTITATSIINHGFSVGNEVCIKGTDELLFSGYYRVTEVISPTVFKYVVPYAPATSSISGKVRIRSISKRFISFVDCENINLNIINFEGTVQPQNIQPRMGWTVIRLQGGNNIQGEINAKGVVYGLLSGEDNVDNGNCSNINFKISGIDIGYPFYLGKSGNNSYIEVHAERVHRGGYIAGVENLTTLLYVKNYDVTGCLIGYQRVTDTTTSVTKMYGSKNINVTVVDTGSDIRPTLGNPVSSTRWMVGLSGYDVDDFAELNNINVNLQLQGGKFTNGCTAQTYNVKQTIKNVTISGLFDNSKLTGEESGVEYAFGLEDVSVSGQYEGIVIKDLIVNRPKDAISQPRITCRKLNDNPKLLNYKTNSKLLVTIPSNTKIEYSMKSIISDSFEYNILQTRGNKSRLVNGNTISLNPLSYALDAEDYTINLLCDIPTTGNVGLFNIGNNTTSEQPTSIRLYINNGSLFLRIYNSTVSQYYQLEVPSFQDNYGGKLTSIIITKGTSINIFINGIASATIQSGTGVYNPILTGTNIIFGGVLTSDNTYSGKLVLLNIFNYNASDNISKLLLEDYSSDVNVTISNAIAMSPTIKNGGFETLGSPTFANWEQTTNGTSTVTVSNDSRSGANACQIQSDSSNSLVQISQVNLLQASYRYKLTLYAKSNQSNSSIIVEGLTVSNAVLVLGTTYQKYELVGVSNSVTGRFTIRRTVLPVGIYALIDDITIKLLGVISRNEFNNATITQKGLVNQAAISNDTATAPSATYTQAEVQAILTELRDLKTKLRTAGILAT